MTSINLGALRISEECGDLYDVLKRSTGFISGTHDVDIPSLPISPEARFRLAEWSLLMNAAIAEHEQQVRAPKPVAPAPPQVVVQPEPVAPVAQPAEPQIDMSEVLREEQAALQKASDEARGLACLEQFCEEQGLQRTPENAAKVQQWLNQNLKGYWSQQGVDAAIANLGPRGTNVLTWKPKEAPAPPPPAEPQEVLGTLPDGTTQLPLDVDQFTLSRASKEQARDWLKRHNAGKLLRPRGGFGSSF
jgi:hypothetical protein